MPTGGSIDFGVLVGSGRVVTIVDGTFFGRVVFTGSGVELVAGDWDGRGNWFPGCYHRLHKEIKSVQGALICYDNSVTPLLTATDRCWMLVSVFVFVRRFPSLSRI